MDDLAAIAASSAVGASVTAMKDAQQAQKAIAAQLLAGIEAGSRAVAADTVQLSPAAQQLYQAYGNAG